jgi:hypothetical protein
MSALAWPASACLFLPPGFRERGHRFVARRGVARSSVSDLKREHERARLQNQNASFGATSDVKIRPTTTPFASTS